VWREDCRGVTVYLGAVEVHISGTQRLTTTYYFAGGQRIAMRKAGVVYYLHGDHLGSASLATDASGAKVSEMRYTPYGEVRPGLEGTGLPTDRRFTGQRREAGLGLYDYGARYYDPALGRFIQADTMVPSPANPQSLNRYAYVLNNPLRYTDPSGHYSEEEIMKSFGVSTWDEVLAFFQNENSSLYGRWGWLEILRRATDGTFLDQGVTYSLSGGIADWRGRGIFESSNSGIFLRCLKNLSGSELMQFNPLQWERFVDQKIVGAGQGEFAGRGEAKDIYRLSGVGQSFYTHISTQYSHVRFDASKVDWVDAGFDLAGITADLFTVGLGGRAVNVIQAAEKTGSLVDALSIAYSLYSNFDGVLDGESAWGALGDVSLSYAGIGIQFWPDVISIVSNIGGAVTITN